MKTNDSEDIQYVTDSVQEVRVDWRKSQLETTDCDHSDDYCSNVLEDRG